METLIYFDDPRNLAKYKRSYVDPDFEEYWNQEIPDVEVPEQKIDISNEDEWEEVELDE